MESERPLTGAPSASEPWIAETKAQPVPGKVPTGGTAGRLRVELPSLVFVEPRTAGSHTVRLLGYPVSSPPGTTLLIDDASLARVFVPRALVALWSDGFETGWWDRWSLKVR